MVISVVENICKKLIFCKECNVECCNKDANVNMEDDDISVSFRDHEHEYSISNTLTVDNLENCFNFDSIYVLSIYPVTSAFFDMDDIGKFVTDLDGICLYINVKGAEHIGEQRKKIRFSLMWSHNVYNEDIIEVMHEWQNALEKEIPIVFKERRVKNNQIAHLIIEAHPVFSRNRFKGMKGIIMRVTKPVWNKCDVKKCMHLINEVEEETTMLLEHNKSLERIVKTTKAILEN